MNIYLDVVDEKLSFRNSKPFITSGDVNIHSCYVYFDINWYDYNAVKYLYVLKDDKVIDVQQLVNNSCAFGVNTFKDPGVIQFVIMMINTNGNERVQTTSRLDLEIYEGYSKEARIPLYPTITFYRGCTTTVTFDLRGFDLYNGSIELTIKRKPNTQTLFTKSFTVDRQYNVVFSSDFTGSLNYSDYVYDLVWVLGEERYPLCAPSKIKVVEMVNNG